MSEQQQTKATTELRAQDSRLPVQVVLVGGQRLAGVLRIQFPANATPITVPCTGSISPNYILSALKKGADGVLVSGCHIGDCHYIEGNFLARRKIHLVKELLGFVGVSRTGSACPGCRLPKGRSIRR